MSGVQILNFSSSPPPRSEKTVKDRQDADELRILVGAHSHPEVSKGGAEIAAFALFHGLGERPGCKTWFVGCDRGGGSGRDGATFVQPFSEREYLYVTGEFEWFRFANRDPNFPAAFEQLMRTISPDVVHLHHFINFGVEVFALIRRAVPRCRIILTLHEYLGICHHMGQMVTKPHWNLCRQASRRRCTQCFPEFDKSDFYLRDKYIKRFLDLVDHFVCPSHFLAERFVSWGLPESKMAVIENVVPAPVMDTARQADQGPLRIGFFGQISMLKGINVLLEAAQMLERTRSGKAIIDIYGEYRGQPAEFQADFLERLSKLGTNVKFHGPYDGTTVDRLMQSVHAVIVPSIWWENSPLVIQEAFRNRRPVICSDIGGMAEKVRNGIDGFHFRSGNPTDLAALLERLADDRTALTGLRTKMRVPPAADAVLDAHLRLYRGSH
jgi:glycosyltransferase involved in cell wall biosynthesis